MFKYAVFGCQLQFRKNESLIVSNGNFVMLVAHTGADAVVEQFNALFA